MSIEMITWPAIGLTALVAAALAVRAARRGAREPEEPEAELPEEVHEHPDPHVLIPFR